MAEAFNDDDLEQYLKKWAETNMLHKPDLEDGLLMAIREGIFEAHRKGLTFWDCHKVLLSLLSELTMLSEGEYWLRQGNGT